MYLGLVSYFGKVSKQQFVTTNPQIGLDTKVNELNKLSTQILYFVEYLLYSLQNKKTFIWQYDPKYTGHDIQIWLLWVYPQRLEPGAVQRALLTEYVVVKEVEVEMEVVVIQ